MFRRKEHQAIGQVLAALDTELLASCGAHFGGGTRLVLEFGEYRLSQDLDFLCSDPGGFSRLRLLAREKGCTALFRSLPPELEFPREAQTDQYGVRFPVRVGDLTTKVDIVREGRIVLNLAVEVSAIPVPCLDWTDSTAEKLLANSDRWPDRQVLARDLIDLAVLRIKTGPLASEAWKKAESAYGAAVRQDLGKALRAFLDESEFQARCFFGLQLEKADEVSLAARQLLAETLQSSGP